MRQIKFDVKPNEIHVRSDKKGKGNGLLRMLESAYSEHFPVAIFPDDVLNNISAVWAKYITLNAEAFRKHFVKHEGKKALKYRTEGIWGEPGKDVEILNGLVNLIKEDQGENYQGWMEQEFTTTSPGDRLLRVCTMMASQKEYYEYYGTMLCGFPQINLMGEKEDWEKLQVAVSEMGAFDDGMKKWRDDLVNNILPHFVAAEANEDFWQAGITRQPYGSGGQATISGWIKAFNPINERGDWVETVDEKDRLDLCVDFEVNIDDNGHKFVEEFRCGPTNYDQEGEVLCVTNYFEHKTIEGKKYNEELLEK